ncbi:MAG: hypothetical protein IKP28_06385 [Clostridia bacterium]|nr:hypothetical protein [Clostridia bacterium]
MAEKESIKVGLGTTVCIFIIILLIVGLGITYYLGFVKNNERISELEAQIVALENDKAKLEQENQTNNLQTKDTSDDKTSLPISDSTNKEITEKEVMDWYSNLGKKLFGEFLSKQKELSSYKINSCNMIYYYDDEFVCVVNYDVKPNGSVENSPWLAGNGEIVGDWIKGKGVFLSFKKENGEFVYNEEAGQSTGWSPETYNQ